MHAGGKSATVLWLLKLLLTKSLPLGSVFGLVCTKLPRGLGRVVSTTILPAPARGSVRLFRDGRVDHAGSGGHISTGVMHIDINEALYKLI
jgi:hypothetical protein